MGGASTLLLLRGWKSANKPAGVTFVTDKANLQRASGVEYSRSTPRDSEEGVLKPYMSQPEGASAPVWPHTPI